MARARGAAGVEVMTLGHSTTWLPSVAAPAGLPTLLVGEEADRSGDAIRSIKTCITKHEKTVTVQAVDGPLVLQADEIASAIIREARERTLAIDPGFDFTNVRVGCPAEWDRSQRLRLQQVLREAGIEIALADILDEPVAAAIAWIDQQQRSGTSPGEDKTRLLVFDYGGGTLDIAVCEITWKEHQPEITVLSCDGITDAGDRLDESLAQHVSERIYAEHGVHIDGEGSVHRAAVRLAARRAKEGLSVSEEVTLDLASFDLPSIELSRQELENIFQPQLDRALEFATYCMRASKLRELGHAPPDVLRKTSFSELAGEFDSVLLAGGMSQIPLVGSLMQTRFMRARIEHVTDRGAAGARRPQHAIVSGLVHDPDTYDRLNLHRPGFDIHLRWRDRSWTIHSQPLYEAHTRIYSRQDIYMGVANPRYFRTFGLPNGIPAQRAQIVVTSETGELLPLRVDRKPQDHLEVHVRANDHVAISMYVDGRLMLLVNGEPAVLGKNATVMRIERWHAIRNSDRGHTKRKERRHLELTSIKRQNLPNFAYPHK